MKTRGYALCMIAALAILAVLQLSGTEAAMAFLASKSDSPVPAYEITDLGTLGEDSYAYGINNAGQVVGYYYPHLSPGAQEHAFLWQDGVMHDLGTLPSRRGSEAKDINDPGEIVGDTAAQNGQDLPISWNHGVISQLETPAEDEFGSPAAINNAGQIVGTLRKDWVPRAVLWEDGTVIELSNLEGSLSSRATGINERGQIVGISIDQGRAVLWEHGGAIIDLGFSGAPSAINNSGQIVGSYPYPNDENGYTHPFLLDHGTLVRIELPGEISGKAVAINNSGQIVGVSDRSPVLWEGGKAYYLEDLIPPDSGWTQLTDAMDINDRGQIVGTGVHGNESRAFLMTPVRHQSRGKGK